MAGMPAIGNPGIPVFGYTDHTHFTGQAAMDLIRLGKKGQVTIPKAVLKRAGIADDAPLLVAAAADGSIVLRQAGVYPIELYTDQRIAEFERANTIPPELGRRAERLAKSARAKKR